MKSCISIFFVLITIIDSPAQTTISDITTGKSYTRTQVLGYSLIGAGITFVAEGIISLNSSSSNVSNEPLPLFIGGVAFIGGGIALVIKGNKKKKKKNGHNLNPTF